MQLLTIVQCSAQYRVQDFAKRNLDTVTKIYAQNVYPVNLGIIANGSAAVPPGLFSANAKGRITPVGNFTGFDDSTEYFFGLAPIPTAPDYAAWSSIKITHFSSACPEVASSVVYFRLTVHHPGAPDDGKYITTLKQVRCKEWVHHVALDWHVLIRLRSGSSITKAQYWSMRHGFLQFASTSRTLPRSTHQMWKSSEGYVGISRSFALAKTPSIAASITAPSSFLQSHLEISIISGPIVFLVELFMSYLLESNQR